MLEAIFTRQLENSLSIIFFLVVYCGLILQPLDSTNKTKTSVICLTSAVVMAFLARGLIFFAQKDMINSLWNGVFAVASACLAHSMLYTSAALSRFSATVRDKFLREFFDPSQGVYISAYIILLIIGAIMGLSEPRSPEALGGGILCAIAAFLFYKLLWQLHNRDVLLKEMGGIAPSSREAPPQ